MCGTWRGGATTWQGRETIRKLLINKHFLGGDKQLKLWAGLILTLSISSSSVVSLSLKLSFPVEPPLHNTGLTCVQWGDTWRTWQTVKPGHTRLPCPASPSCQTSPGTYLQVQVVGRHGNCREWGLFALFLLSSLKPCHYPYSTGTRVYLYARSLPDCQSMCLSACLSICLCQSLPLLHDCSLLFPSSCSALFLYRRFIHHICLFIWCTAGVLHVSAATLFCTHSPLIPKLPPHTHTEMQWKSPHLN